MSGQRHQGVADRSASRGPVPVTPNSHSRLDLADVSAAAIADQERSGFRDMPMEPSLTDLGGAAKPGYEIPYFDVNGKRITFKRFRYLPKLFPSKFGEKHDDTTQHKYSQPEGSANHAYFSPCLNRWPKVCADASQTLLIVEGEKKAFASCKKGFVCIGLGGIWNWKVGGKDELIPELEQFAWKGRTVVVICDSDAATNHHVRQGGSGLCTVLKAQGAQTCLLILPQITPNAKTGLDDFLVAKGKAALQKLTAELIEEAKEHSLLSQEKKDVGNADRLLLWGKGNYRYVAAFNRWAVYTRTHWPVDDREQEAIRAAAHAMIRVFGTEALQAGDKEGIRWAADCLNSPRITNMLREAQPHATLTIAEMDRDPLLINFRNGTLDGRTMKLRRHQREDYITKVIPHNYNPTAHCPKWETFIDETFDGDRQVIAFVQRALGYSLTGDTSEKCILIVHGPTNTAKTTLLTTVKTLLGDFAGQIKVESLMVERGRPMDNNAQADLADLRGKRFVMTSETGEGQRIREELIKLLAQGQGTFRAVRKYENPFAFPETWKIWMDCNHLPVVRGTDDAIWDRLIVIPFEHQIPKAKQNKELSRSLVADEAEGILAWLVRGLEGWLTERLRLPAPMQAQREEWRTESDDLGLWIAEQCVKPKGAKKESTALYENYKSWRKDNGFYEESAVIFARKMKEHGFVKKEEGHNKVPHWLGITLKTQKKAKF
jgi:putative DNA primase/helicase